MRESLSKQVTQQPPKSPLSGRLLRLRSLGGATGERLLISIIHRRILYPSRKFFNSFFPSLVKIDSGWNCTPHIG